MLKAVDEQLRSASDAPTIGLLLCKTQDKLVTEYALSDIHNPAGIAEYQFSHQLPAELQASLSSVEAIEAGLLEDGMSSVLLVVQPGEMAEHWWMSRALISVKTTMADSQRGIRGNCIAVQKDISISVMKKFP